MHKNIEDGYQIMASSMDSKKVIESVKNILRSQDEQYKNKRFIVAISGGIDSMVLLNILVTMNLKFSCIHVNYNLRGKESIDDLFFIQKWADQNNKKLYVKDVDLSPIQEDNISIQNIARKIRYTYFDSIKELHKYDFILTAHHKNDRIETSIYNFIKGTGLRGITSIKSRRDDIIRPLIHISRNNIVNYAKNHNIEWREDSSNVSLKYKRNFIRHKIMPNILKINTNAIDTIGRSIDNLTDNYQFIKSFVNEYLDQNLINKLNYKVLNIAPLLKYEGLQSLLFTILEKYNLNQTQAKNIHHLVSNNISGTILANNYTIEHSRRCLYIEPILASSSEVIIDIKANMKNISLDLFNTIEITETSKIYIFCYNNDKKKAFAVQKEEIVTPLVIRNKKNGEAIKFKGMNRATQSLKKYYNGLKLSKTEKKYTYILADNNKVYAVLGHRNSIYTEEVEYH